MSQKTKKSVRNGLIGLILLGTFSFVYGGIYTEMIQEGLEVSIANILLAFIGGYFISGFVLAFVPIFLISWLIYSLKSKK